MRPMNRSVITVDGLAGSGKTTISKLLAERLGYAHLSTGLLYRAVGWLAINAKVSVDDGVALKTLILSHKIELIMGAKNSALVLVDGRDVSSEIHAPLVSQAASQTSRHREVREALRDAQRNAFPGVNLVVEGRDMGTVIFPDAPLKFFVFVSPEIRVQRRIAQLHGPEALKDPALMSRIKRDIEIEVLERDKRDSEREVAPAKPADDAILIDNSAETLTLVIQNMYDAAASRGLV